MSRTKWVRKHAPKWTPQERADYLAGLDKEASTERNPLKRSSINECRVIIRAVIKAANEERYYEAARNEGKPSVHTIGR